MAVGEKGMPAAIICFESFRSERDRRRARDLEEGSTVAPSPFRDRLAHVILNARQIAHRRTMLEFGSRRLGVAPLPFREATSERE
jgi:hypothetical protein